METFTMIPPPPEPPVPLLSLVTRSLAATKDDVAAVGLDPHGRGSAKRGGESELPLPVPGAIHADKANRTDQAGRGAPDAGAAHGIAEGQVDRRRANRNGIIQDRNRNRLGSCLRRQK